MARQFAWASITVTEILLKVKKKICSQTRAPIWTNNAHVPKMVKVEWCSTIGVMKAAGETESWKAGVEEELRGKLFWRNAAPKVNQYAHYLSQVQSHCTDLVI